jgi:outer membrane protein assembly factor BamB
LAPPRSRTGSRDCSRNGGPSVGQDCIPSGHDTNLSYVSDLSSGPKRRRADYAGSLCTAAALLIILAFLPPNTSGAADAAAQKADTPWDFSTPRRPFAESCFERFGDEAWDLTPEEARRWLDPVEGRALEITVPDKKYGTGIVLKGIGRLRAPWPDDAVLRLLLYNRTPLKLYFWTGDDGIRLQYYADSRSSRQTWAAYRMTRAPAEEMVLDERPHESLDPGLALVTTDSNRNLHAASGIHEVRYQDGTLVLSQGDLRLVTVPVAGPPKETYFEADGSIIKRIAMYRGDPVPAEPRRRRRVVMRGDRPAELRWDTELPPGARLERRSDGAIRLLAQGTDEPALGAVPLVRPGLYEIIVVVDDPLPGTGLYFADAAGKVLDAVGFAHDARTSRTTLGFDKPDAPLSPKSPDMEKAPVPYVAGRVWMRLVLAGGRLRCWLSGEGVHWGEVIVPHQAAGAVEQIGVYCKPAALPRAITLCRLHVRELDALASLGPPQLREKAFEVELLPEAIAPSDVGAWEQWIWESQPPEADSDSWRRACALALLATNQDAALASAVLDGLLRESLAATGPLDRKLAILEDAALVCELYNSTDCRRFASRFYDLGHQLVRKGDFAGFDSLRHTLMRLPRFSPSSRIEPLDQALVRSTLEARTIDGRWEEAARLCRQLRFWAEQPLPKRRWSGAQAPLARLVDWAQASSASRLLNPKQGQSLVLEPLWRHPVFVELDKEAQNTLLEMRLALRDQAWRTACQVLLGSTAPHRVMVPDQDDPQRFTSFSATLATTIQQNPALVRTMGQIVGSGELMRLSRAQAAGDVEAVENATVRYYGTPAAAEAFSWLGDHWLARGEFTRAITCYEQAMPLAGPAEHQQLGARLRLAAAMLGRSRGEPVVEPVRFGQVEVSPAEFEGLVAEMLAAHQSPEAEQSPNPVKPAAELPAPAPLTVRSWGELDGAMGTKPEQVPSLSRSVDWLGRQHTMVAANETLVVSNRFQVIAFDLKTGAKRWTYDLGEGQGATHAWPLVPMRPLVRGGRVYSRLVPKNGRPALVCLDLKTGDRIWTSQYPGAVASDPVLGRDRLLALCDPHSPDEPMDQLALTSFQLATGVILDEAPLVTLGGQWRGRRVCQLTVAGDRIVATVAGAVICCDTAGQLLWIRRNTWIPAPLDPYWGRRLMQPPLVAGDRVLVTQPGTRAIDCLDLAVGRVHWRRARPTLRRVLGIIDQMLVALTDEAVAAISLERGEELWRRPMSDFLEGSLMGAAGRLVCTRRVGGANVPYASLEWLDGRTGQLLGRQPLWTPSPKHVLVGPLASDGQRLWCLTAVEGEKGKPKPQRELFELVPNGSLPAVQEPPEAWNSDIPPALRAGAEIVLPGWRLLSAKADKLAGLQAELGGRTNVLVTRADNAAPVRLVRHLHVPEAGKPRLVLNYSHDPQSRSRIEVRVAGLPVWQHITPQPIDPEAAATAEATWTEQTVDLSEYAGRQVWITVLQTAVGSKPAYAWWQTIDFRG